MNMKRMGRTLSIALAVLLSACAGTPSAPPDRSQESIAITTQGDNYVLTVPISRLTMTLPAGGFVRRESNIGGGTANPRYFYFEDRAAGVILSGWFEPDRLYEGAKAQWAKDTDAWKKRDLPEPRNVAFTKVGNWEVINYDIAIPRGTNTHIRAHLVQAGTWIDLHVSITSSGTSAENRAKLAALLRSISVRQKA
jgi:hypothetical protein